MPKKPAVTSFSCKHLGPVSEASVVFGDLTVLVGPQASGKSVLLQTLKLVLDRQAIVESLRLQGFLLDKDDTATIHAAFYGEGMGDLWTPATRVSFGATKLPRPSARPTVFYIPAQRVLTLKNGWPRNFGDYSPGDPYVVKEFSEQLRLLLEGGLGSGGKAIFPGERRFSLAARKLLRESIFVDFELRLEVRGARRHLVLQQRGKGSLPFMVWSAGQREFSPLLLGLYHLLQPGLLEARRRSVEWVVLEEPEMGLHPRAITAVLFLVLELIQRGYRLCISTHSPHVLDLVWALRVLSEKKAPPQVLLRLFDVPNNPTNRALAADVLGKTVKVYSFNHDGRPVVDISRLDPTSDSAEEGSWGGLTEFSTRASDVIADFIGSKG